MSSSFAYWTRRKENHSNGYSAKILIRSRWARTCSAATVLQAPAVVGYEQKAQANGQPDAVRIWMVRLRNGMSCWCQFGGASDRPSSGLFQPLLPASKLPRL